MADQTVPVFSLAELQQGQRREEFEGCLAEKGIFYLTDCGVTEADHRRARDATMDFFENGSDEEWASLVSSVPTIRRGFMRLGAESTARVTNTGDYSDYAMSYSMGTWGNLFPGREFERAWTAYFDRMYSVARHAARQVLDTVGFQHENGMESFLDCDPVLRFRHFPEVPEHRCAEVEPLRMAQHYDISIVTLIHQTPCPNGFVSLQCDVGGTFVDVPVAHDALVVLIGAVTTVVTGGRVRTPNHHVIAPTSARRVGSGRTSSVFFLRPKPDFRVPIALARTLGFRSDLPGETATFQEWIGENYIQLHRPP